MRGLRIREEWRRRLATAGLTQPAHLLEATLARPAAERGPAAPVLVCEGSWQLLSKPGLTGRQRWRWEFRDDRGDAHVVFVKRYDRPPLRQQWNRLTTQNPGHSSAWWEYHQARRLAELHIPAADAIGYVEHMFGLFEARSAVLLEDARGEAFDRWWTALREANDAAAAGPPRHDLTCRLARFICAFHQTGLRHRDLYLCHIFIHFNGAGAPELRLIDLARTFRPRWRRTRWLLKDLSQLEASARQIGAARTDRLRFLLAYVGLHRLTPPTRRFARRIMVRGERILQRIARKGA